MKNWEAINQLKNMIETYENLNTAKEEGVVIGLYYAVNLLENGKEYADQRIKMPHKTICSCNDEKDGGC